MSDVQHDHEGESDAAIRASRNVEGPQGKPRVTLVGLFTVIFIVGLGIGMLIPAIDSNRVGGRRASCLNKAHQLGLAMQNYASAHNNAFPPSAEIVQTSPAVSTVGGYSFLVKLLPYMEYDFLYKSLPQRIPNGDIDAAMSTNTALANAMNTSLREFVCPSNNNIVFQKPNSAPPKFAFTNYKAIGATTRNSLIMASNRSATPPYGTAAIHPDGAIYPSAGDLPMTAIADGTSHTIIIMETIDDQNSRWMVGNECTMVGLPQSSSPTGAKPAAAYPFFAPSGFDKIWGDASAVSLAGLRTFLMYDFSPTGPAGDVGKYEDPGWAKAPPAYGPSSAHPAVVIVGFADGSVTGLSKRCDAANLFFLLTKNGSDPFNIP
jgi:hypothetical protein